MQVIDFILSDVRVQIVISLVLCAVLVAGLLTYLEFRAKAKRNKKKVYAAKEYFIRKLQKSIRDKKTPLEKLDALDHAVKDYFHNKFGTSIGDTYSGMEIYFEKTKRVKPAYFCRLMFEAYYSTSDLNNSAIDSLTKGFVEIYRATEFDELSKEKNVLASKLEDIIYVNERTKRKDRGFYYYVFTGIGKTFGFVFGVFGKFFNLFVHKKEVLTRDWVSNFEDIRKENILKNFEEDGQVNVRRALILKEKAIAQKKLEELKKKKFLREEEKRQIKEFEDFLNRNKKEEHLTFYGQ